MTTTPREFSLAGLVPKPLTFRDSDNKVYEVRTKTMFGALELATFNRLQARLVAATNTLMAGEQTEAKDAEAAVELEQILNKIVETLIPDLPKERLEAMRLGQKTEFVGWWRQEQMPSKAEAEASGGAAGQRSIPA